MIIPDEHFKISPKKVYGYLLSKITAMQNQIPNSDLRDLVSIVIDYLPESFNNGFFKHVGLDPKLMIDDKHEIDSEEDPSQVNLKKKDVSGAKTPDHKNKSLDMFFKKK